jgi:arsenate reductase
MGKLRVLFLCSHNSARSQMAQGLLRALGGAKHESLSAGITATSLRPEAVMVMEEIGIDIREHTSKTLGRYLDQEIDTVVTVCDDANEVCPVFPRARRRIHWSVPDPSLVQGPDRLAAFRAARDDLRARIRQEFVEGRSAGAARKE